MHDGMPQESSLPASQAGGEEGSSCHGGGTTGRAMTTLAAPGNQCPELGGQIGHDGRPSFRRSRAASSPVDPARASAAMTAKSAQAWRKCKHLVVGADRARPARRRAVPRVGPTWSYPPGSGRPPAGPEHPRTDQESRPTAPIMPPSLMAAM